jgi:hypothetical protein
LDDHFLVSVLIESLEDITASCGVILKASCNGKTGDVLSVKDEGVIGVMRKGLEVNLIAGVGIDGFVQES